MKKLIYLALAATLFWACEKDEQKNNNVINPEEVTDLPETDNVSRTLSTGDYKLARDIALELSDNISDTVYALNIFSDEAFNNKFTGKQIIPSLLSEIYPDLSGNDTLYSTALITYNYATDKLDYLNQYWKAPQFELTSEDYLAFGITIGENEFFYPSEPAEKYIPTLLSEKYSDAQIDQLVYITYNESDVDPVGIISLLNEDFQSYPAKYDTINGNGWTQNSVQGKNAYLAYMFGDNTYAQGRGYNGDDVEEFYLISPAVDLSSSVENTFSFDVSAGYWTHDGLDILISSDYDGSNFDAATWDKVTSSFSIPTSPEAPDNAYMTMRSAGTMSLSSYSSAIYIAFKYSGGVADNKTGTYQIDNVLVKGNQSSKKAKGVIHTNTFYQFNGSTWNKNDDVMILNSEDYEIMGSPVSYGYFSSSNPPENYLPQFLSQKFPYAQENNKIVIAYQYYVDNEYTLVDEYVFLQGKWEKTSPIEPTTNLFVYKNNNWVTDPQIKLTPTSSDYQLLVDYVYTNLSRDYGSSYGNDEFYYGASAYYLNFDLRLSNRDKYAIPGYEGLDTDSGVALAWQRVEDGISIMMGLMYPDAVSESSSLPIYYWITFKTYENDLAKRTYTGVFQYNGSEFARLTNIEDEIVVSGELTSEDVNWNR